MRTFSSGVCLRLAATLTWCMKPLVSWVLASAASALSPVFWDTIAPFLIEVALLPLQEPTPLPKVFGFVTLFRSPIIADTLHMHIIGGTVPGAPRLAWAQKLFKRARQRLRREPSSRAQAEGLSRTALGYLTPLKFLESGKQSQAKEIMCH